VRLTSSRTAGERSRFARNVVDLFPLRLGTGISAWIGTIAKVPVLEA
jgi:hypothetical protein